MDGEEEQEGGAGAFLPYISKRKRKNTGITVSFDENARREFVTGFHKRKVERRRVAEEKQKRKKRQKHLQERAERRLAAKKARGEVGPEGEERAGVEGEGEEEGVEEEEGGEEGGEGDEVDDEEEADFGRQNERLLSLGRTPAAAPVVLHYDSGSLETFVTVTTDFGTQEDEGRAGSEEEGGGEEEKGLGKLGGVRSGQGEGGGGRVGAGSRSTALQIAKVSSRRKGRSGGRQQVRRRKKSGEKGKDLKRKKRHGGK
ncbi:hypothetical protein CLOM_g11824 [Closterium sp. NIES-68]|nr:hypothetical protein CLOM_g11824 [Closterium sp. NIES-68]GJP84569.1 hypothetical protein CLOP_g14628 [Closterium sp. NIES-67]